MKKMAALLLALAMAAAFAAPAGAGALGLIPINNGTDTYGSITGISLVYASGHTETVDLVPLLGPIVTLYPQRPGDVYDHANIDYTVANGKTLVCIVSNPFPGAPDFLFPPDGILRLPAACTSIMFYDNDPTIATASLMLTIRIIAPKPGGGGGGPVDTPPPAKPGQEARIIPGIPSGFAPVYDSPDPGANLIGQVPSGSAVHLLQWSGNMCRLLYNNDNSAGWVSGEHIEVAP